MAEETPIAAPPAVEAPPAPVVQAPVSPPDPLGWDDSVLGKLPPEHKTLIEPAISSYRQKVKEELEKRESEIGKYKAYGDKATALDKLTQYQPFVQWWNEQQKAQSQQAAPQSQASQQEWQEAIYEASQGDGSKMQALQARLISSMAAPVISELQKKQQTLDTKIEMRNLFETHPDAKELDQIGLDPKTKEGISLLEMGLEWAEKNNKSLEDGYNLARKWADSMSVTAQQKAMGMIAEKKQGVVSGPSTSSANTSVTEVDSIDDLIKKSMDAELSGNKGSRFVVRK